jgi:hypothetical protein
VQMIRQQRLQVGAARLEPARMGGRKQQQGARV